MNSAPACEQTAYLLPLSDSLFQADARLQGFCQDTRGDLVSSKCHSWRRGKQSASLNNAVTWNYHRCQLQVCPFEVKHKLYDHGVLSFSLPAEDFITTFKAPKRSFDIPTDKIDVVFFQLNLLQWHKNVQQRISPFASDGEEQTGESLLNKMRKEQDIMRCEALKLQGRAQTSRRRASERHPNRSKEQVRIRRLHATRLHATLLRGTERNSRIQSHSSYPGRTQGPGSGPLTRDNPKTCPNLSQLGISSASGKRESASPTAQIG